MRHIPFTIPLFTLLLACGGDPPSARERFEQFGAYICDRRAECDLLEPEDAEACIPDFVTRMCLDVPDCDASYPVDEDRWDTCLRLIDDYDCTKVARNLVPTVCVEAWREPPPSALSSSSTLTRQRSGHSSKGTASTGSVSEMRSRK